MSGSVSSLHLIGRLVFVLTKDLCEQLILTRGEHQDRDLIMVYH